MSGVETLGVIASATQLAAYSIKIVLHIDQIYTQVRDTSSRMKTHLNEINQLIEITTLIEQHKSLRTPIIHSQIQKTLVEAESLYTVLKEVTTKYCDHPIWRCWVFLRGAVEEKIFSSLTKLEREKSTLTLCINVGHTDILLNIQGSISTFANVGLRPDPDHPSTTMGDKSEHKAQESLAQQLPSTPGSNTSRVVTEASHPANARISTKNAGSSRMTSRAAAVEDTRQTSHLSDSKPVQGKTFTNTKASKKARQHAGDNNKNGHEPRNHAYNDSSATDDSFQHLGDNNS